MVRWLGILLALGLASSTADAQVFKPKSKAGAKAAPAKTDTTEKKTTAKKSARTSPGKKRVTTKKKNQAAERGRPDDLTPDAAPKESDRDFVKITDDDDVE